MLYIMQQHSLLGRRRLGIPPLRALPLDVSPPSADAGQNFKRYIYPHPSIWLSEATTPLPIKMSGCKGCWLKCQSRLTRRCVPSVFARQLEREQDLTYISDRSICPSKCICFKTNYVTLIKTAAWLQSHNQHYSRMSAGVQNNLATEMRQSQ